MVLCSINNAGLPDSNYKHPIGIKSQTIVYKIHFLFIYLYHALLIITKVDNTYGYKKNNVYFHAFAGGVDSLWRQG